MILIIGDVHCQFQVVNEQIQFAEKRTGKNVDAVIILGDMGIYEHPLHKFFCKEEKRFLRKVFFIEGNHEDFTRFNHLVSKYSEFMTHLPRGHVTQICQFRVLSLGGARYLDAVNSPPGSEIKDRDIDKCLEHQQNALDLIVSHDCPMDIGVTSSPGLEFYGKPGFARSQELIDKFQPQKWFFGHHHRWFLRKIQNTEFLGLPESWKGFGLLDDQLNYATFENLIATPESWFQKLIKRLFR